MARKASDLFSLLQSRGGKGRGGSSRRSGSSGASGAVGAVVGAFGAATGMLGGLFRAATGGSKTDLGGRSRSGSRGGRGTLQLSGLALFGMGFVCLGIGYLLGDAFPLGGPAALRAGGRADPGVGAPGGPGAPTREPARPGPIGEQADPNLDLAPLTNQGLFLTMFPNGNRQRAFDLATYLQGQGFETARPYWCQTDKESAWVTVVYYDGPTAAATMGARLREVPACPAIPEFEAARDRSRKLDKYWPPSVSLR